MEYSVCDEPNSFSLNTSEDEDMDEAGQDNDCTSDYIRIEGGASTCQAMPQLHLNKFCGEFLSTEDELDTGHDIICGT